MLAAAMLYAALLASPQQTEQAKTLYQAGSQAYQVGKYGVAIEAFEATRALSDRPLVIFSLAQAYRLRYFQDGNLSDLEAAATAYRAYVIAAPQGTRRVHATQHLSTLVPYLERTRLNGDASKANRTNAARLIITSAIPGAHAQVGDSEPQPVPATFEVKPGAHTVQVNAPDHQPITQKTVAVARAVVGVALDPTPVPGQLTVDVPAGTRVMIDHIAQGQAPLAVLPLTPGPHALILSATGREPERHDLSIAAGQTLTVRTTLQSTTQRSIAWALMGTAGALALSAGITGTLSLDAQSDAEALEAQVGTGLTGAQFDQHASLRADRDAYADATLGLSLAASSALITGFLLYLYDDPAVPRTQSNHLLTRR
jgi:hypothetical protein